MGLKIAQINARRSAAVAANMEMLIKECNIDLLCVQKPYSYKSKVRGYTSPGLRVIQPMVHLPWVAAVAMGEHVEVFHYTYEELEHVMCIQIKTEHEELYMINAYCQFSLPLEPILGTIERIINKIGKKNIIIVMDANASSEVWFSTQTDERGKLIEEFLLANRLFTVNEPDNPPTFCSTEGESNIDLTIVSESLLSSISEWRVSTDCTTSDHNLITFKITQRDLQSRKFFKQDCYDIKRANWKVFTSQIADVFNRKNMDDLRTFKPDKAVALFDRLLNRVCRKSIPKKKLCNKAVPWWNENLNSLRKEANRAKKQMLRARKLGITEIKEFTEKYKKLRNKFVREIRFNKKETWEKFVTVEGNKNPWSIPYKIIRDKLKASEVTCSLILPNGEQTKDWLGTVKALLQKVAPDDDTKIESARHKDIRVTLKTYENSNVEEEITLEEIGAAIQKSKSKKALDFDGFTSEIVKALWKQDKLILYNLFNNCFKRESFPAPWRIAKIKFITKDTSKDRRKLNSYRPIALLSIVGKIYERAW